MEIQVLGCNGGQLPGKRLTSFLINNETLIDAGGVTDTLGIDEQKAINHIVISHAHMDHIRDIPMLADNVYGMRTFPIDVIAAKPVIESLKNHIFNNAIWPDFTVIPSKEEPVIAFKEAPVEKTFSVGDLELELVEVNHTVPTFGMFITEGETTLLYTGDTGPTVRIWEKAKEYSSLKAIIVETSFPNKLAGRSLISGHLSPCHLETELGKLGRDDVPIYLYHFKPNFESELIEEVMNLRNDRIRPLEQGEIIRLGHR